jgi:hypothetical protein
LKIYDHFKALLLLSISLRQPKYDGEMQRERERERELIFNQQRAEGRDTGGGLRVSVMGYHHLNNNSQYRILTFSQAEPP